MANNFKQWQSNWEEKVPEEIEHKILHHAHTLSHFGRVIELFVPNALQTAAQLIGGGGNSGPNPRRGGRYAPPVIPEGRPPAGGGAANEQMLPSDSETL